MVFVSEGVICRVECVVQLHTRTCLYNILPQKLYNSLSIILGEYLKANFLLPRNNGAQSVEGAGIARHPHSDPSVYTQRFVVCACLYSCTYDTPLFPTSVDFPQRVRMVLLDKMATIELVMCSHVAMSPLSLSLSLSLSLRHHLASGTSEKIQVGALLGVFQIVRDLVTAQHT